MKIIEKAFIVWHDGMLNDNPNEGYCIDSLPVYYADTAGKAKQKASELYDFEIDGEEHQFTDIKVKRAKYADLLLLDDGEKIKRGSLEQRDIERKRIQKRIDKVNSYPDEANFYVQNGYVGNSVLWWGKRSSGYVSDLSKAELYTKKEILKSFVNGREQDKIWYAKHILENIKQHVDAQFLNKSFES